jgi:hypothetical protein
MNEDTTTEYNKFGHQLQLQLASAHIRQRILLFVFQL